MNGRRGVLLVDTQGRVQAIRVTPASVQDRDRPAVPASELARSSLVMAWADLACEGEAAMAPMTRCAIEPELIRRQNKTSFEVEPK
jgi:hypothetical protein